MDALPDGARLWFTQWNLGRGGAHDVAVLGRLKTCIKDASTADILVVCPDCVPGLEDGDVMECSKLLIIAAAAAGEKFLFVFPEDLGSVRGSAPLVSPFSDKDFMEQLLWQDAISVAAFGCSWSKCAGCAPLRLVSDLARLQALGFQGWPVFGPGYRY